MTYQQRIKDHLSTYRERTLGIPERGTWTNPGNGEAIAYGHILPAADKDKNILRPYRQEFWKSHE